MFFSAFVPLLDILWFWLIFCNILTKSFVPLCKIHNLLLNYIVNGSMLLIVLIGRKAKMCHMCRIHGGNKATSGPTIFVWSMEEILLICMATATFVCWPENRITLKQWFVALICENEFVALIVDYVLVALYILDVLFSQNIPQTYVQETPTPHPQNMYWGCGVGVAPPNISTCFTSPNMCFYTNFITCVLFIVQSLWVLQKKLW